MLLGRRPKDYDVATDARPGDVIRLFRRTLKVGARFGVVIVLIENRQVEVAAFRTETAYSDGRHPSGVKFTTAAEDASRRDFTVNGMFYDPIQDKVIDYVDGKADLQKRIIRTIGDPGQRFAEDYLRMLRAIRFSTQLDFAVEPATFRAIRTNAAKITKISGERIAVELEAILTNPNRTAGASMLIESSLAEAVFAGFLSERTDLALTVLGNLRKKVNFILALTAFFTGLPAEFALESCRILKLSRSRTKRMKFLLTNRGRLLDSDMSLAQLKKLLAEACFQDLYELQRATQKALGGRKSLTPLIRLRRRIRDLGDIELRPKPLLNGHDLMQLGAAPGPLLGRLAEEMYIAQLEGILSTRKQAEQWAGQWLKKHKLTE